MTTRRIAALLAVLVITWHSATVSAGGPKEVTFNKDVAPILFRNCAGCHRPGEVAPFSLLNYRDASKRSRQIAELGGGPTTDLTHGMLWAALGLEIEPQPALRLVAESKDAPSAKALEGLANHVLNYLGRMPDMRKILPDLPKILANVKPTLE